MGTNLAFIDSEKCRLCRKCVPVCPTNAIIEIGFPPRKEKEPEEQAPGPAEENQDVNINQAGEKTVNKNINKED